MDQNLKPILLVSPLALEAEFSPIIDMDLEATIKCTNTGTITCGGPGEVTEE